jgi:hypothetical protein
VSLRLQRPEEPDPVGERLLRHRRRWGEHLERVRAARVEVELDRHPGGVEPGGVGEVLGAEQVELADVDERAGQAAQVGRPGRRQRRRAGTPSP